jgi:hypothetical protein
VSGDGERAAVLAEMRRAHLAEIGARTLYGWLARLARDAELRRLMAGLEEEEALQVERLQALMRGLGAAPRRTSRRRRAVSTLLAWSTSVFGSRPVLRLCEEAEGTASRWYAHFAQHFLLSGAADAAATCHGLAQVKARHAQALRAWVDNAPRR